MHGARLPDFDPAGTLHIIGDIHFGECIAAFPQYLLDDLVNIDDPLCHVQIGDSTNTGTEDAQALAFLNSLPAPWYTIVGNTDVFQNNRTVAAWEAVYGMTRWTSVDKGRFQLILISPDQMEDNTDLSKIRLTSAALAWLDSELAAATKPCLICSHAPLAGTHLGWRSSATPDLHVAEVGGDDDTPIRSILAAHDTAFAWISGHLHTRPSESQFVKQQHTSDVYSPTIACISSSALDYNGHAAPPVQSDAACSVYVTVPESADRVEVRARNHKQNRWTYMQPYGLLATLYPGAA